MIRVKGERKRKKERKDYMKSGNGTDKNNGVRINKYLSAAGVCSRREADRVIENGQVTINGSPAECGSKVMPHDVVEFKGKTVSHNETPVLLIYNKPAGVVCSTAEKDNIVDYIGYPKRIYPVGRLDKNSEGLILLTNQGDISDAILRSANNHEKEYIVKVNRNVTSEFLNGMSIGVPILDTVTKPCVVRKINDRTFSIIITQGLNRQIRRMCEYFDYRVVSLKRIRIMDIKLGNLKSGQYIEMGRKEIETLRKRLER